MISIKNLSKSFGKNQVLKGINLHLHPGRVVGIVGENGAGKTTLFRCMTGLEQHDGTVESDYDMLKNHLGFLETDPFFFAKITGGEYLKLLSKARGIDVEDLEAVNVFDLPLNQYAATYSTGMKKKLAIMGILVQNNDFFILDEPFNGVDIQSNIIITEIIKRLRTAGRTILISSHIFSTLKDTCDEIHLLREGLLVRKVDKADFDQLESEMKAVTIGSKLDRLKL